MTLAMDRMIDSIMLNALEMFHYTQRFRGKRFVLILDPDTEFSEIIMDLRLLDSAGIEVTVFCNDSLSVRSLVEDTCIRGTKLRYSNDLSRWPLSKPNAIQVIGLQPKASLAEFISSHDLLSCCHDAQTTKIFLISAYDGLTINGRLQSHTDEQTLNEIINRLDVNIPKDLLELIQSGLKNYSMEIIILGQKKGSTFLEVFTHQGCGTLFSPEYPNIIRKAVLKDTHNIMLLMKPAVEDRLVLPLSEDEVAQSIGQYSVYTINDEIVAAAKITNYDNMVEMGKFSTLPRFRGRGRAHELAIRLLDEAKRQNKEAAFALSTSPKMWDFFERLGFKHIDRKALPESWARNYDFTRNSRALIYYFE
jgi:N-acetylglutamate synthase-like GNAT family acetyltransferase